MSAHVAHAKIGMPEGWRDVPMPLAVAALPRTASGIPITYTVAWTSETVPEAREDPLLRGRCPTGTLALFHSGSQGEGSPKLAVSDVARVRRAVILGLCQACGRQVPGSATSPSRIGRWLCDLRNQGQEIKIGYRRVPLIVDGWTCEPCLAYALRVCPGLVKKDWQHDAPAALRVLRVHTWELIATLERVERLDVWPVVGWVKIAATGYTAFTPDSFLANLTHRATTDGDAA